MKYCSIILSLIILSNFIYPQIQHDAKIEGRISNCSGKSIKVENVDIPINGNGSFNYKYTSNFPKFIELKYDNMSWLAYVEPGKNVKFEINQPNLSSLNYEGDLITPNLCLKKICLLDSGTNNFLNNNWYKLHTQGESYFISIIDSIKNQYLKPLVEYQTEKQDLPADFVKLFKAEINSAFNILIVDYPDVHLKYTGEKTFLSNTAYKYLNSIPMDDTTLNHSSAFVKFCKKWIDYTADTLLFKNSDLRHYNLRKMDILPKVLSSIFKNPSVVDYWYSEYLNEHIENTGIVNSEKYLNEFNNLCTNKIFKQKINDLYSSYLNREKDHIVKTFKTENGFKLNAHIFYPGNIKQEEKRPAIVIFHGGGFVLGNPSWAFEQAKHYAGKGIIAIAAQYRLSNFKDITPIEAIQDAKDLIFWLRKNSDSLKIMENKIAASGWSVGGQLCATLAIFPDTLPGSSITSSPNAILLTSPGTSSAGWFTELLNGAKVDPLNYSPVDHVRFGLPPAIILQGIDDTVTPFKDVKLFYDKMESCGNYCELWTYDNVGHLFTPTSLGDSGWPQPDKEIQKQADARAEEFLIKFGYIKE